MTVFKRPKKNDLFATKRACLQDGRLSNAARGLLALMLSMPPNWDFYQSHLVSICAEDGKDAIRSQMKELVEFGYLLKLHRDRQENGTFGKIEYEVYDDPQIKKSLSKKDTDTIFKASYSVKDFIRIYPEMSSRFPDPDEEERKKKTNKPEAVASHLSDSTEEIKIISPKADFPTSVKPIEVEPHLEHNKELSSTKKETNKQEKEVSTTSDPTDRVVCSFRLDLLKKTQLTDSQAVKIETQFAHLADDTFKEAVEAFLVYAKKTTVSNYVGMLVSALGGGKEKKPWTKTKDKESKAVENRARTQEILGKYDMKKIKGLINFDVNILRESVEFTCNTAAYLFEYKRLYFKEAINGFFKKAEIQILI